VVSLVLGFFAVLALLLATIGLYGVVSYSVAQRTHEVGVRIALGAQRRNVLGLIVQQGLWLAAIGTGIGLICALVITRFLAALLYGVTPTDPLTLIAIPGVLLAVALLASYLPARRAARVDPVVALRTE
jgi:putative ABC transport system permease protein